MNKIVISKKAQKQLKKIPDHIQRNLQIWASQVEMMGINEVRKIKGYHDEPLLADRKWQRSVRLSKAYRAFYIEHENSIIIEVIEVNKHDY
ncbi:MAG: type II toxin-antitoxin system mRNA interferase toxin, RelE/StbE family [Pseudomonadota bacterium]